MVMSTMGTPKAEMLEQLRRFAEEVMPAFPKVPAHAEPVKP